MRIADELTGSVGRLDVLVNNAAIHYDSWQRVAGADLGIVGRGARHQRARRLAERDCLPAPC